MDTIRLIEAFLENKLEGKELEDFLHRIENEPELKEEINLHREINNSIIDEIPELRKQISRLLPNKNRSRTKIISLVSALAAIFIIGFALLYFNKKSTISEAYSVYYSPYITDLNTRSSEQNPKDANYAYYLYQKGDYITSYELLKNYNKVESGNYKAILYCGLSALELNLFRESENCLVKVSTDSNSLYSLHADWYLSMLYLKTNNTALAKKQLSGLAADENYYSKRAQKILKKYF